MSQKVVDKLHERFADMQALRARSIRVDRQQHKVFVVVSFPHVNDLSDELRRQISDEVKRAVPKGYYGIVSFADDNFSEVTFRKYLADTLKKRFPVYSINREKTLVHIDGRTIDVTFVVSEVDKQSMETSDFLPTLTEIVADYTSYEVTFMLSVDEAETELLDFSMQEKLVKLAVNRELMRPARVFRIENVVKCIGKLIDSSPMYISDIRKAVDSCVLCGKISDRSLKSSKNNPNLWILKMKLTDESPGAINVVMYARLDIDDINTLRETHADKTEEQLQRIAERKKVSNEKKLKKMMGLFDGQSVVVRGRIKFNDFSEELEMLAFDLCTCDILPIAMQPTFLRGAPDDYSLVRPEGYEEYRQMSFTQEFTRESPIADKKFVVLHINGTGFEMTKDKFFAMCAVKVDGGRITEQWFTYLNPEISVDATELARCETNVDKLVYCPTITEIVPDLYKFTDGCDIVGDGHIGSTMKIINYYAAPVGFRFDNNLDSEAQLLGTLYDKSSFDKKPNCANIADVCKALKQPCLSETFCKHTSLETARCICLLAENC